MSRQTKSNSEFIATVTADFYKHNHIGTISDFAEWLVRSAVMPERILNRWLAVRVYYAELERTKCTANPKGVKWKALNIASEKSTLSVRTIKNLLTNKA